MKRELRIALVGDYREEVIAHRAIPLALEMAGAELDVTVTPVWAATEGLDDDSAYGLDGVIGSADGIWCVPASPYLSTSGALRAIRFARERGVPFMGTCGGFQHAVLEFAQNVLGWEDAAHAEMDPDSQRLVIAPLSCSLVEQSGTIHFVSGTRLAQAYGVESAVEGYHCRYGLAPGVQQAMEAEGMVVAATDDEGDVRGIEIPAHPFFVATLFQHERSALKGVGSPAARAFVAAAT